MTSERIDDLTVDELVSLVERVFAPRPEDRALGILVDLPRAGMEDRPAWRERREMAASWRALLASAQERTGLRVELFQFPAAAANNADLPDRAWPWREGDGPAAMADELPEGEAVATEEVFAACDLFLAPTELSATAPLKMAARRHGFRAATMPGFSRAMIPALRLDYEEVDRRCRFLKGLLDRADRAELRFRAGGDRYELTLDLRHRQAHASGGLLREPGTAGNLPSGETYVVPYEGELAGEASRTEGRLPVQLPASDRDDGAPGQEVVVYRIEGNRAVGVEPGGAVAEREAARLVAEPAYGNLAELGLGVLGDFGLRPVGSVLLDEKLGLHIAFGRSEHFGGSVGPGDFSSPAAVVHIDRVYLPETQPLVTVETVDLVLEDGTREALLVDGRYAVDFDPGADD